VGLELLFMAILAERQAEGDEVALPAQQRFLREHLLQWAPAFCGDVVANARTDLFRGLGLLTRGLLTQEQALLQP
jgi:TorA maturation chaperone TorD